MQITLGFFFCTIVASVPSTWCWQQSDREEYNEGSLPVLSHPWNVAGAEKRNTWWTKKSLQDEQLSSGCFAGKCSLMFTECLRQAEDIPVFMFCKEAQYACLATCVKENREHHQINNVAMNS